MLILGIDENGLGPVLGPLTVTAAAFLAPQYDPKSFWELSSAQLKAADSKVIYKRSRPKEGEASILKWLNLFKHFSTCSDELRKKILLPLAKPCPNNTILCKQKTSFQLPLFCSENDIQLSQDTINSFEKKQVIPVDIKTIEVCPGFMNNAFERLNINKLQLDFKQMLKLINYFQTKYPGKQIIALCGKVGGTTFYLPWLQKFVFDKEKIKIIEESKEKSTYEINNITISFIKDGDGSHLPIAVASMIGKYIRELGMLELNHLLGNTQKKVSGYRDSLTKKFITETSNKRKQISLPDKCFLRTL